MRKAEAPHLGLALVDNQATLTDYCLSISIVVISFHCFFPLQALAHGDLSRGSEKMEDQF